ncbi:hypothetical protein [uncultured Dokdonia sp.]|uniref:hypothetical protein n=1 Tax=uncultured Dokdonia sp. TaxID=575653 RepID=UPI00262C6730|nr:hypothetical protein [uncultured Dokdonia sp.]
MYKTLFLFLLFTGITAFSQETIILKGTVLNDTIEKASLSVVNLNLRKGAITNEAGVFEIPVRINDTIHISAIQYESRQFVVTPKMHDQKRMSLYLVPKINELDEIQLSNKVLSGNLEKDASDASLDTQLALVKDMSDKGLLPNLQRKTKEERRLHTATTGINGKGGVGFTGLIIPLPLLINEINGKTKRLKKHIEIASYQEQIDYALNRFPDVMLLTYLKIPEDQLQDFIFYALKDEKKLKEIAIDNPLVFLDYLLEKSITYKLLKKKEQFTENENE